MLAVKWKENLWLDIGPEFSSFLYCMDIISIIYLLIEDIGYGELNQFLLSLKVMNMGKYISVMIISY